MSDWTRQQLRELLEGWWRGEWGTDPSPAGETAVVYRSTDIDDNGHLREDAGAYRSIAPPKLRAKKLVPGDVLLEASGGAPDRPVGRTALYRGARNEPALAANFLRTLRPKKGVSSEYLNWVLLHLHQQPAIWRYQQQTTGMSNLKVADYLSHELEVPDSHEQLAIATVLRAVHRAIDETETAIAKMQQVKLGMMHELFTRGVTPDGCIRPTVAERADIYSDSVIGPIPHGWSVGSITDYVDPFTGVKPGPFGSSLTKDTYTESGYRVYGQEQVIAGSLQIGSYYISAAKFAELRQFEVKANDVLLSLVGTVGCALVATSPFEPGIINPRLIRLRPTVSTEPRFLRHLLLSGIVTRQLHALSGGGTMPVINGKVIRRLRLPIISAEEQVRIADGLRAVDETIDVVSQQGAVLKMIRRGLMQDLLSGEVSVRLD